MSYQYKNLVIIVPVRLASTRLPNKAIVDIHGKPKIQRIYEQIAQVNLAPVYIAAGDKEIVDIVSRFTSKVILTDPALPSGTDRIAAALKGIDPSGNKYPYVMNFQGDAINTNPQIITELMDLALQTGADITTPAMILDPKDDVDNPKIAKIAMGVKYGEDSARALYFSRNRIPHDRDGGPGLYYHHIGLYLYTAQALQKFVSFPPGILEQREKLEQLRALENGLTVYVKVIKQLKLYENAPADIDTPEDLEAIRKLDVWK